MLGVAASSFGAYLNLVALNLFVFLATGSALIMGVFMTVRLVAGVVGGMVSAAVLERVATKPVLLWTGGLQAAALLLLALAPQAWLWGTVFVTALVVGLCAAVFQVGLRSAIPEIVGPDRRDWANSLMVTARSIAMVAGFASAGVIVSLLGYTTAFLINAVSFLLCVAAVAVLPMPGRATADEPAAGSAPSTRSRWSTLLALAAMPALGIMVGLRAVDALGSSSHNTALPVHSTALDPNQPAVFISVFWACWAVGNVVMQQVIRRRARQGRPSVGAIGFGVGTIVMSTAFILVFCGFPIAVAAAVALVAGAADGLTEVSYTGQIQQLPIALRTRTFGLTASLESLGFGVGTVVVAASLEVFDPLPIVAVAHGLSIVGALVFLAVVLVRRRTTRGGSPSSIDPTERTAHDRSTGPDQPEVAGPQVADPGVDGPDPGADRGDRGGVPAPGSR